MQNMEKENLSLEELYRSARYLIIQEDDSEYDDDDADCTSIYD